VRHASIAIELLGEDGWTNAYERTLDCYALRAESEYLSGQFAVAEELYEHALRHAKNDLDRIRILTIKKDHYELQGRYVDAIAVLREGLSLVGIDFPDGDDELRALLAEELSALPRNLRGRSIASLVDAPEITDPRLIATLQLLMGLWPSCYVAGKKRLLSIVSVKIASFCLAHGNCEVASAAYVNYSFVAGVVTGDYQTAYEFGRLGIELSERYPNRAVRAWCYFLFGCGTAIWRRPLVECAPYLERSFELGVQSGSLASACYACSYIVTDSFFRGAPLSEVEALYSRFGEFLAQHNPAIHMYLELGIRSMRRLVGRDSFDDTSFVRSFGQSPFFMAAYAFGNLAAAYHLDDVTRARECADIASRDVPELLYGIFKAPEMALYAALAWLAAATRATGAERAQLRDAAERQLIELRALASECEENFAHKALLVEAELAHVDGKLDAAARLFDRAAAAASRAGAQQNVALAHELAAQLWRDRGVVKAARAYLEDAYDAYERWGATEKLKALAVRYPDLLRRPSAAPSTSGEARSRAFAEPFDLLTVAKASQAISREIEIEALLGRLMHVMIENAGARRGALVTVQDERLLVLASSEGLSVSVHPELPLEAAEHVVENVVRYATRTGEVVLLDDAAREGRFVRDPQVRQRQCRSIACIPLRLKDRIVGAVYLENELTAGAFTPGRLVVLELLAGQAAISLDNARLYTDLKTALRQKDEALVAAQAASRAKDEFLAILGHELRNPLAPILTACDLMAMRSPHVDPTRVAQTISNVLTNAAKFSEPHSVVTLVVRSDGGRASVAVRDRGAGIDPALLPQIFDMFVQGRQPIDRTTGGLGLGLTIARNLVELHGGTIRAHSDGIGRGSEFVIELPTTSGATAGTSHRAPSVRPSMSRRILVVDDNVEAAVLLAQALEMMGHNVAFVHDGPSALRKVGELVPDIAILDIGLLPAMNGFELARRIRELLAGQAPRLIALSGYASSAADDDDVALFDAYFVKPINFDQLERAIAVPKAAAN
jgi:CheY-like chemotaxis protein